MGVVSKLQDTHGWNGGVFFWAVNEDMDATWSKPIATYLKSYQGVMSASALFDSNDVNGLIRFSQDAPGLSTAVDVYFKGLDGKAAKAVIHEHPVPEDGSCDTIGEPLEVVALEMTSSVHTIADASYKKVNISDISALFCRDTNCLENKNEIELQMASSDIELSGPTTIVGASIVLYDTEGNPMTCATISPGGSLFAHPGPQNRMYKGAASSLIPTSIVIAIAALAFFM
jgi:hypothetical protein